MVGPGSQQAPSLRRGFEGRVVDCDGFVDVDQGRRCRLRWEDGEAESVGLIWAMVWVLAENDHSDFVQRAMAGPGLIVVVSRFDCHASPVSEG